MHHCKSALLCRQRRLSSVSELPSSPLRNGIHEYFQVRNHLSYPTTHVLQRLAFPCVTHDQHDEHEVVRRSAPSLGGRTLETLHFQAESRFGTSNRSGSLTDIMRPIHAFALGTSPIFRNYLTIKCLAYVGQWREKLCPRSSPPLVKVRSSPLDECHHVQHGCPVCNPNGSQPRSISCSRDVCLCASSMTIHTPSNSSAGSFLFIFHAIFFTNLLPRARILPSYVPTHQPLHRVFFCF